MTATDPTPEEILAALGIHPGECCANPGVTSWALSVAAVLLGWVTEQLERDPPEHDLSDVTEAAVNLHRVLEFAQRLTGLYADQVTAATLRDGVRVDRAQIDRMPLVRRGVTVNDLRGMAVGELQDSFAALNRPLRGVAAAPWFLSALADTLPRVALIDPDVLLAGLGDVDG